MLELDARNVVREICSDALVQFVEGLVKGGGIVSAVSHCEPGIAHSVGTELTGLDDIEEFVAEVEPVVHGIDGCGRGYDAQVGGLGEAEVVLAVTEEGFNEFGIVCFSGLLFAKFRHGGLQEAEIGAVFICELVEALGITDGVQGMHDAVVQAEAVVELGDLALVGIAFLGSGSISRNCWLMVSKWGRRSLKE